MNEELTPEEKRLVKEYAAVYRLLTNTGGHRLWSLESLLRAARRVDDLRTAANELRVLANAQGDRNAQRALLKAALILEAADAIRGIKNGDE